MVRYLLSHSEDLAADLSAVDGCGLTPLLTACDVGRRRDPATEEIVGMLLNHGASVQDRTNRQYDPLFGE